MRIGVKRSREPGHISTREYRVDLEIAAVHAARSVRAVPSAATGLGLETKTAQKGGHNYCPPCRDDTLPRDSAVAMTPFQGILIRHG